MKQRYQIARWVGHQHWCRGRGRPVSLLCPPDGRSGEEFNVEFFGHRYHGLLDDFIDRHVYLFGGWELHILALMSQLTKAYRAVTTRPVTYVDVGANTGQHALFMSGHADNVICFEPFEPVRRRLEARVVSNRLHNISVVPLALSAQAGTSFYYSPEGRNQGTGSLVPAFCAGNRSAPIVVGTDVGDNYFQNHSNRAITVLKIDVEGGGRGVLEGLRETLLRCRPAVILELSEYTRTDIGSLARLYDLLYPAAVAFTIGHIPGRVGYRLQECDFEAPNDILIMPLELSTALPLSASFGSVPTSPRGTSDHHRTLLPKEPAPTQKPVASSRKMRVDQRSPMRTRGPADIS